MKVSVSLPAEDVAFLDAYARAHNIPSRSAAVQEAIRAFRLRDLDEAYGAAFAEWSESEDARLWDASAGDGL